MRYVKIYIFLIVQLIAAKALAQLPVPSPLYPPVHWPVPPTNYNRYFLIFDIKYPLDTCIKQTDFNLVGIDKDWLIQGTDYPAKAEILDTAVASFADAKHNSIIIHKRGTFRVVLTSVHPTCFNADCSGFFILSQYINTFILTVGPPADIHVKIREDIDRRINECGGTHYYHATVNRDSVDVNTLFQWQLNGTNVSQDSVLAIGNLQHNDVISCSVTNPGPCVNIVTTDSLKITSPPPSVIITSSENPVCANTLVTFNAKAENAGSNPSYHWRVNGKYTGVDGMLFNTKALANNDKVTCTLGDVKCEEPITSNIVTLNVLPLPTVQLPKYLTVTYGGSAELQPEVSSDIVSYSWSPATYLSSPSLLTPVISPLFSDTYTLTVTDVNGCQGQGSVYIDVPFFIPNAFTPNDDGINDTWDIPQLIFYPDCMVQVMNRYGQRVFQSQGYGKSWDGKLAGKRLPQGVYYYFIKLPKKTLSGSLTVIR